MRIQSIGIYNAAGARRLVKFHDGLNILTGWSGTGKSSLLDIAEFCLGRSQPTYAEGALTDAVAWFSLTVEHEGTRMFIARPAAPRGARSTQQAMIELGVGGDEVDGRTLLVNADTGAVREQLTRLLGMPGHDVRIATPLRVPLEATVAQALFYCFQAESEITNKRLLFHRADEREEVADTIRETLPYFLGAAELNTVALRRQLDQARGDLRRAEARLARQNAAAHQLEDEVGAMLSEARVLGLIGRDTTDQEGDPLVLLQEAAVAAVTEETELGDAPEQYRLTRQRQRDLVERLLRAQEQAALARHHSAQRRLFETEVDEQRARLQAINLLPEPTGAGEATASATCPLCGSALQEHDVDAATLHAAVDELGARLAQVADLEPRAAEQLHTIEAEVDTVRAELRQVDRELAALAAAEVALQEDSDVRARRAFLQGRVTAYLETARTSEDDLALRRDVEALTARVQELGALVDLDEQQQRVDSILQFISRGMTEFAQRLELEHSEHSVRLDIGRLTVVADTPTGPIDLSRMGSQANIVGYHLVAHLALHQWFVQQRRPVPRFIFFDQPTQPFYPDEVRSEADEAIDDQDRIRVAELFALLRDVAEELNELQIIVPDHANLPDQWFQDALVDNWRDGNALVPQDWL
jgi:DNA repair exonuclease SbcCD ATPase subunit